MRRKPGTATGFRALFAGNPVTVPGLAPRIRSRVRRAPKTVKHPCAAAERSAIIGTIMNVSLNGVSLDHFANLGMRITRGRAFEAADNQGKSRPISSLNASSEL